MKDKYVLIVDIKSSRTLDVETRFAAQKKLKNIVSLLNKTFQPSLLYPMEFSSGDSVQGLFDKPSSPLKLYYLLTAMLSPYEIHGGIGVGDINDLIYEESIAFSGSNYMDGEAYHRARSALDKSKERKTFITVLSKDYWNDCIVNKFLNEALVLREKLSIQQFRLLNLCDFLNPILNDGESAMYNEYFYEFIQYLDLDNGVFERYMYKDKLYHELRVIFDLCLGHPYEDTNKIMKTHIPDFAIMPRNSDAYLAKLYGVTRENIWWLKKRGKMDEIRTAELLAVFYLERNYND